MPVRAAASPAAPPAQPYFERVDILHPVVAAALRPVLSRAFNGQDSDCLELAIYLGTVGVAPAIVTNGCKESAAAGALCIVPTLLADWNTRLCFPLTRCVHCVLHNRTCDLHKVTLHMLIPCPCDWLIPSADMHNVAERNRMVYERHELMAHPHKKRRRGAKGGMDEYLEFIGVTNEYDQWFLERIRTAHTADIRDIQQVVDADGEFIGPNWIIPPTYQWHVCPCFPGRCDIANHPINGPLAVYDAGTESFDGESDDGHTECSGQSHAGGDVAPSEVKEGSGSVASAKGNGHGHVHSHSDGHGHAHATGCDHDHDHGGHHAHADSLEPKASLSPTPSAVDAAEISVVLTPNIVQAKAVNVILVEEGQCCGQW